MEPFTRLSGIAAPLPMMNVDTDMIIPKQFLKTIKRTGLGVSLFFEHRYDDDGNDHPHFVLNHPHYGQAQILITGENFGCGSSREHAPWALLDFGIRCIIAPSFADIFFHNCFKNGILPVVVEDAHHERMMQLAHDIETSAMTIDLHNHTITTADGVVHHFQVDPFRKECLINGLDDIGLTMQQAAEIDAFETKQRTLTPWLYR